MRCGNCGLERDGQREACECVPAWVWRDRDSWIGLEGGAVTVDRIHGHWQATGEDQLAPDVQ